MGCEGRYEMMREKRKSKKGEGIVEGGKGGEIK